MDALSNCHGSISINNDSFHIFYYADNLILTSLSITGLQEIIDPASSYIIAHGLNFNATKTICTFLRAKHFETKPEWHLNGSVLREEAAVTYLGTVSFILVQELNQQLELSMVCSVLWCSTNSFSTYV